MIKGYMGKMLFIDLSTGSRREDVIPEHVYRDFIGGQGLGARILFEHMKPGVDPLGPENMLGFLSSPLTGAGFHGARLQVVGKSPVSGGWGDSNMGGGFAVALKATGYDAVFISGASPGPSYVYVNDGAVEIRDASSLWGKDTYVTDDAIREETGEPKTRVVCIGPAGETQSLAAAIMQRGSAAARSGLGAVMGAKNLKALAVYGTHEVSVAQPQRVAELRSNYRRDLKASTHDWVPLFRNWGTCSFFESYLLMGDCPIKNWTLFGEEGFPTWNNLHGDSITRYQEKKEACPGCPLGCKGKLKVADGPYATKSAAKIEYETLGMFGSNLLIDDPEPLIKANHLCNIYGLDTCTAGSAIGFAMECYERGVITKEDTGGIELGFGNADTLLQILELMARREGFGAVLADGSKLAAERIGKGSQAWAVHVGGQDLPAHDPRTSVGHGWGYICDPTPGRHTASQFIDSVDEDVAFVMSPQVGIRKVDLFDYNAYAEVFATCSDMDRVSTSAGLCWFGTYPEDLPLVEALAAITGWDFTIEEALKAGRRIQALRQAFNIREGVDTTTWVIPPRLDQIPESGPIKGRNLDFAEIKRQGYKAFGWDPETGAPLPETLAELRLTNLVGDLSPKTKAAPV